MNDKTKVVQENLIKITPSFAVSLIPDNEGKKKVIVFCDLPENAWEEINKEQTEKLIEALQKLIKEPLKKIAKNGKEIVDYDKIPAYPKGQFINIPGCYCENCGETFALYHYSVIAPTRVDENGKPVFDKCFKCENDD